MIIKIKTVITIITQLIAAIVHNQDVVRKKTNKKDKGDKDT